MKTIIHFEIPKDRDGNMSIEYSEANEVLEIIQKEIGDEYICIASPLTPCVLSDKEFNGVIKNMKVDTPDAEKFMEDFRRRITSM